MPLHCTGGEPEGDGVDDLDFFGVGRGDEEGVVLADADRPEPDDAGGAGGGTPEVE